MNENNNNLQDLWMAMSLSDASFPGGTLGHSQGVEVCHHFGFIDGENLKESFGRFIEVSLQQNRSFSVPFVKAGWNIASESPDNSLKRLQHLDHLLQTMLTNEVAIRASTMQGKGFFRVITSSFPASSDCIKTLSKLETDSSIPFHYHYPPLFGFICHLLHISLETTLCIYMKIILRDICIGASRLNIIGPMESTTIQFSAIHRIESLLLQQNSNGFIDSLFTNAGFDHNDHPSQTCFFLDYFQSLHDRLYSRLFNS